MRSSTGAVVLVATAAVLLLTWPEGAGARAGAPVGAAGGAAGDMTGGSPGGGVGGGLGSAADGAGAGAGGASPDAVSAAQVPGGAVGTIPDIGGAGSGASAPSATPTGTAPTTAPAPAPAPDSKVLVLGSVFFPSNATQLGPDATRMLDGIATTYKGTAQQLEIVGHADARGSAQANLRLSAQRAEAVRSYLAANGIPPGNMRVSYDGARTPMARGVDPEANAQNRRVEVRVP